MYAFWPHAFYQVLFYMSKNKDENERLYKYSETDFNLSGELFKLSDDRYKIAKNSFHISPGAIDSELLEQKNWLNPI